MATLRSAERCTARLALDRAMALSVWRWAWGFYLNKDRVPDAVRHSSCRSAEPGPLQMLSFVTAPAQERTNAAKAAALASGARVSPPSQSFPEHDRRHPARHQRHECGHQP